MEPQLRLHDVSRLTPEQRRAEVAGLLALALYRLRFGTEPTTSGSVEELGCSGEQSVHANPPSGVPLHDA